jgi:hypothetical protein
VCNWPRPAREGYGQSTAALPGTSDVDFLGDLKRDGRVRFGFESGLNGAARRSPGSARSPCVERGVPPPAKGPLLSVRPTAHARRTLIELSALALMASKWLHFAR